MTKKTAKQLEREIAHALITRSAHARRADDSELEIYSKEQLERKPTISEGHSEDLKVERKVNGVPTRWWLSRMTVEDGARNSIDVEQLQEGRWRVVHRYGEPDRSSHARKKQLRAPAHARTKKITAQEAKKLLLSDDIDLTRRDYFDLSPSEVGRVLEVAKLVGYRKAKNAPGSTGRMFVQYLRRLK